MKISTRLSLAFSLIASTIFLVFGVSVYWFASNHRISEFKERLNERVLITEKIHLEKESFSKSEFDIIKKQFSNTLPNETEEVIEILKGQHLALKQSYPQLIADNFRLKDTYFFEYENVQGLSKQFKIKGKEYVIIVAAVDETGLKNLVFLKNRIMLLIGIGIPLLFIGSFVITKKALAPLTQKITRANEIGASNLHQRLTVINPEDEIGKLAIAFNNLLDRLEASFEAQKAFISNASHEIKNPLTAIMGEAEVAASKTRTPVEYIESLNHILNEAETLNSTVSNLLQLSKITAHEDGVQFEEIEFIAFLKEVKSSFDFVTPGNKIVVDIQGASTSIMIWGNKGLLKAALFNMLDNACKFSSNGEVHVSLSTSKDQFKIEIADQGIGISKTDIAKIKAPFYRGNNTVQIKGSGIGLSLTDKIIFLHQGELNIQSELGEGTVVELRLPLLEP
ncbi:MAG: HAMP domain-containing histidine kinase [Cyclobacteriaceae bacterium]|nr:HAMP domain-containing histidine kinase [Cyclobacteriaceae bacterium]